MREVELKKKDSDKFWDEIQNLEEFRQQLRDEILYLESVWETVGMAIEWDIVLPTSRFDSIEWTVRERAEQNDKSHMILISQ